MDSREITMAGDGERKDEDSTDVAARRPPLQFSICGLLLLTAAVALLFGSLKWLGVTTAA